MKRILLTAAAVALFADGAAAQQADPLQDPTPAGFRAELIAGYDRDGSEDGAV